MDDRTGIFLRWASASRPTLGPTVSTAGLTHEPGESGTGGSPLPVRRLPVTVLALVDLTAADSRVVAAARVLAGADRATIVLLHVAPPVSRWRRAWGERMATVEAAARQGLGRLARRLSHRGFYVQTAVRFGEPVEQVTKAALAVDATAVVASSRPARWLWWRHRDRRLRRSLDVAVITVPAGGREMNAGAKIAGWPSPGPSQPRSAA